MKFCERYTYNQEDKNTPSQKEEILRLPEVTKVDFSYSPYGGVVVYLNCKPSSFKFKQF